MRSHQVDGQLDLDKVNAAVRPTSLSHRLELSSSRCPQDFTIRPLTLNDFLVGDTVSGRATESEALD